MLDLLYEDEHCLAACKPAGLITQGRLGGEPSLEDLVRAYLAPQSPRSVYLGTVHRLDRPVSGVVLWAKTPKAARRLSDQFARRATRKVYLAVVSGGPEIPEGLWEDWLCEEDTGLGLVQVCRPGTPRARRAVTRVRHQEATSLPPGTYALRLEPETGRTHQLRVQSGSRGWPIVGDRPYGSRMDLPVGIALHAASLTVEHPTRGDHLVLRASPPASWADAGIALAGIEPG